MSGEPPDAGFALDASEGLDFSRAAVLPPSAVAGSSGGGTVALDGAATASGALLNIAWPGALTPELSEILGTICYRTIREAALYRRAGCAIPPKAEAEQAFVIHRMLLCYFLHGAGWRRAFEAELRGIARALEARR